MSNRKKRRPITLTVEFVDVTTQAKSDVPGRRRAELMALCTRIWARQLNSLDASPSGAAPDTAGVMRQNAS